LLTSAWLCAWDQQPAGGSSRVDQLLGGQARPRTQVGEVTLRSARSDVHARGRIRTPVEGVPLVVVIAGFLLVRWIYVLPGLLPVLVGLEYVARRAPHARVLTAIVAFAPMVLWELLLKSPGGFSGFGAVLGVTAVLFAVLARLPARLQVSSTEDRGAAQPRAGTAVAPR
jgi:hypothetical protein